MKRVTAKDIMNPAVLSAQDDMTVHELAGFLTEEMISGAPVLNKFGKLVGVVSVSDIVRNDRQRYRIVRAKRDSGSALHGWEEDVSEEEIDQLSIEEDDGLTARDIMTPVVFKVGENESIVDMADVMVDGRIHRLFITREDKVVGIVTSLDMLKAIRTFLPE